MPILRPTYLIDGDITDINLDDLVRIGIKGIIFDLDSTLIAPRAGCLTPEAEAWLKKARERFRVAVVSNNKRDPYIEQCKKVLDMPVIGRAGKPGRRGLIQILQLFEMLPEEIVVIGDRPLTDIWGGQRAGMKTILVYPLKSMNEPKWKTWFRNLERVFIRR